MTLRFTIFTLSVVFCTISVLAQNRISGTVRYAGDGSYAAGVNVIVSAPGQGAMLGYDITDADGGFSVSYTSRNDSVTVAVTGFNIRRQSVTIASGTVRIDFSVEYAKQKIREVKVVADPVKRQSDTVTYYMENFRETTDRSIGDVLEKLPGIEVSATGSIKYQGKEINKFYIEGLDMLGGRYGIATENIQAKDIAAVEVYENHQPIKMLQDWVKSDRAAINLKLKSEAKGAWNCIFQAGLGYKPFLWNGEVSPMYFGRKFQTISIYKTNNTGNDVSRELASHTNGADKLRHILGVSRPDEPPVAEERYLDNRIHTVSVNTINKLGNDGDITADISYVHDRIESEGMGETSYFLADGSSVFVPEEKTSDRKKDMIDMNVQYRKNSKKIYILEQVSVMAEKNAENGDVIQNSSRIGQFLDIPEIQVRNTFNIVKRIRKWRLDFRSKTDYGRSSSSLQINPTPYKEIFGFQDGYENAAQKLDASRFRTDNKFRTYFDKGAWSFSINAGLDAHIENMKSSLYATDVGGLSMSAADTMSNDISFRRLDIFLGPGLSYRPGSVFYAHLNLPVNLVHIGSDDRISGITNKKTRILFSPSLSVVWDITYGLKFNGFVSLNERLGDLYDSYRGYIMTDYRTVGSKSGETSRTSRQICSADISYGDALHALFFSADAMWWRTKSNVTYGTEYIGTLSRTVATVADNISSGVNFSGRISKRFSSISTTVSLQGGWGRTWSSYMRQGVLMPSEYYMASAGIKVDSRIAKPVLLSYKGDYTRSAGRNSNAAFPPIDAFRQNLRFDFVIRDKVTVGVGGEHYFNAAIESKDRNMFFADASVSFRYGRLEYILEGHNLLNTGFFSSSLYKDMTGYLYRTRLRPLSVLFKVRFSLK